MKSASMGVQNDRSCDVSNKCQGIRKLWALSGMVCLLSFLAACTESPPPVAKRFDLRPPPASLGANISVQQHLRVDRENKTDDLDAALEVDSERFGASWSGFLDNVY